MRKLNLYHIELKRTDVARNVSICYTIMVAARNLKNAFAKASSYIDGIPRKISGNCAPTGNYKIAGRVLL